MSLLVESLKIYLKDKYDVDATKEEGCVRKCETCEGHFFTRPRLPGPGFTMDKKEEAGLLLMALDVLEGKSGEV